MHVWCCSCNTVIHTSWKQCLVLKYRGGTTKKDGLFECWSHRYPTYCWKVCQWGSAGNRWFDLFSGTAETSSLWFVMEGSKGLLGKACMRADQHWPKCPPLTSNIPGSISYQDKKTLTVQNPKYWSSWVGQTASLDDMDRYIAFGAPFCDISV